MKRFQKISVYLTAPIVAISVFVAFFFQNCGKAGFESATPENQIQINSTASAKHTGAPLAFDAVFDQISYMSCFGQDAGDRETFYTIKAGGYDAAGGMRITSDFVTYARSQVKPIYPETVANADQVKVFLSETPLNIGAMPQVALRLRSDLLDVRANSSSAALGIDYVNILPDPTDDRILDPLIKAVFAGSGSPFVNYYPLSPMNRNFEAALTYNNSEQLAENVRSDLSQYSLLTLTFARDMSSSDPRQPTQEPQRAYGRGYILEFGKQRNDSYYNTHNSVLTRITEKSLNDQGLQGNWNCDPSYRFVIYRTEDRHVCTMDAPGRIADAGYRRKLEVMQRHLPPDKWDISVDKGCAVPKVGNCYPKINGRSIAVQYGHTSACYNGTATYPDGNIPEPWCPQHVSFCFRQ